MKFLLSFVMQTLARHYNLVPIMLLYKLQVYNRPRGENPIYERVCTGCPRRHRFAIRFDRFAICLKPNFNQSFI